VVGENETLKYQKRKKEKIGKGLEWERAKKEESRGEIYNIYHF